MNMADTKSNFTVYLVRDGKRVSRNSYLGYTLKDLVFALSYNWNRDRLDIVLTEEPDILVASRRDGEWEYADETGMEMEGDTDGRPQYR